MNAKTPQFDKALDEILKDLKPHERQCKECGRNFRIYQEDIDFYHMLRVPAPKLCPLCRKKRRFGHLMRVPRFYKRKCQVPGHNEEVITVFPPDSPHVIWDYSYWHSDGWDAADFGREFDFTRPFFLQFKKLFFDVPQAPLEHDPRGQNTEYTVGGLGGMNNYVCGMAHHSKDCMYCFDVRYTANLIDCNLLMNSELCYESVASYHCNRSFFVIGCSDCLDCAFLYDCKNCSDCFLSSNIRNKKYVFENEQLTKEEYQKRLSMIDLGNRSTFNLYKQKFQNIVQNALHRSIQTRNTYSSTGDSLADCKNCYFVFRSNDCENVRFSDNLEFVKDSSDVVNSVRSELVYEGVVTLGNNNKFSMYARNSTNLEYSAHCHDCHYCFGCVGLRNKQFHIFNRPYGEEEYWKTVDGIKTAMLKAGEYGEFFGLLLGLIPYQSTNGQKDFPLTAEMAQDMNIPWYSEPKSNTPQDSKILYAPDDIPGNIKDVEDDILNEVIICETTKKPYRITGGELNFYRKFGLPIPTRYYWQRMSERTLLENPIWLYPFSCPRCGEKSFSVYAPEQQTKLNIICQPCYLKEVI